MAANQEWLQCQLFNTNIRYLIVIILIIIIIKRGFITTAGISDVCNKAKRNSLDTLQTHNHQTNSDK